MVPSMGEPESFSALEEHQAGEKAPQTHNDSWRGDVTGCTGAQSTGIGEAYQRGSPEQQVEVTRQRVACAQGKKDFSLSRHSPASA